MSDAIYIPDNPRLLAVLDGLPRPLRRYRDHAALLLHYICRQQWIRRRGDDGDGVEFARLNITILRKYIPQRQIKLLRNHLVKCGVLMLDGYSTGRYSIGYRIGDDFGGLPLRWKLSNEKLIQKLRAWREVIICSNSPEMQALAERRKPITDSMLGTLDRLGLCDSSMEIERTLRGRGINPGHLRYCCSVIVNRDHKGLFMDSFGWRVHSIVTHTTSELRPYLRFDGEPLIELDVRNAQPLILAVALRNPTICTTYLKTAQHNGNTERKYRGGKTGPGVPVLLKVLRAVDVSEINEFARICKSGSFYETLLDLSNGGNRERIKKPFFGTFSTENSVSVVR